MDYERELMRFNRAGYSEMGTNEEVQTRILKFFDKLASYYGTQGVMFFINYVIDHAKKVNRNGYDRKDGQESLYNLWEKANDAKLLACRKFYKEHDAPHPDKPDFDMLAKYINYGFALIPHNGELGKDPNGYEHKQNVLTDTRTRRQATPITTREDLAYWVNEHRTWGNRHWVTFYAKPATKGMLVIDIDAHEGKENGFQNLNNFLRTHPDITRDDFATPVYVNSAGGGEHLYFRTNRPADTEYKSAIAGIDILTGNSSVATGGSIKNGNLYVLHGNLADTPLLSEKLYPFFTKPKRIITATTPQAHNTARRNNTYKHKQGEKWVYKTLDEICMWADANTAEHNYNQKQFASRVGWYCAMLEHEHKGENTSEYTLDKTLQYVEMNESLFGHDSDTKNAVTTAYNYGKNAYGRDNRGEIAWKTNK